MNPKDYEDYKKNNIKASKSQLKEYISLYAIIAGKLKNENAVELDEVKNNIKKAFPKEIYFTLVDEIGKPVKFNITEKSKEYIIPIFTDIREYAVGSAKISKLFLDKLTMKEITPKDLTKISDEDEYFMGFVINPHSQNFNMDRNSDF